MRKESHSNDALERGRLAAENLEDKNKGEAGGTLFRLAQWFPKLNTATLDSLKTFREELTKFNRTLNLVSAKTLESADQTHFADCILASDLIVKDAGDKYVDYWDFGSGNGFPGLIFAALYPQLKVHLVDVDERKCEFLKHVSSKMGLKNTQVHRESILKLPEGSVNAAITRAWMSVAKALYNTRKIIPSGGALYHMKGDGWSLEVGEIPTQLCSFWSPSLVGDYRLPGAPVKLSVVKTEKIR